MNSKWKLTLFIPGPGGFSGDGGCSRCSGARMKPRNIPSPTLACWGEARMPQRLT